MRNEENMRYTGLNCLLGGNNPKSGKSLVSVAELLSEFGIRSRKDWRALVHIERSNTYSSLLTDIPKQKTSLVSLVV